jgi:hypothetical protein
MLGVKYGVEEDVCGGAAVNNSAVLFSLILYSLINLIMWFRIKIR